MLYKENMKNTWLKKIKIRRKNCLEAINGLDHQFLTHLKKTANRIIKIALVNGNSPKKALRVWVNDLWKRKLIYACQFTKKTLIIHVKNKKNLDFKVTW